MATLVGAGTSVSAAQGPRIKGDRLPFNLHDLEGNRVTSEDPRFEGKVVLVDLWGTWCPPCLTEIPTFNELHARYSAQGLVIVGVAFEYESDADERRRKLSEFVAAYGLNYLVLDGGPVDDAGKALPTIVDLRGFPVEVYVDRAGAVVESRYGYGYKEKWARKLEERIVALLAAPAPKTDPPASP